MPDTGEEVDYVTELQIGDIEGQALGGESQVAPWWVGATQSEGFNALPWLVGLAGVGIAAAALGNSDDDNNDSSLVQDNTAPATPIVDEVLNNDTDGDGTPDSTTIKGTTEPGAIVTVTDKNGNVIGETTADSNGNYEVKVPVITEGEDVDITATDSTGNTSDTTTITGITTTDTTAPSAPTDITVGNGDEFITSDEIDENNQVDVVVGLPDDTEAGDTVVVNGKEQTITQQDIDKGEVSVKVDAPAESEALEVNASIKDPAGNKSPQVTENVGTTDPTAPGGEAGAAQPKPVVTIPEAADGVNAEEISDGIQTEVTLPTGIEADDTVTITVTDGAGDKTEVEHTVTAEEVAAGSAAITIPNDAATGIAEDGDYSVVATVTDTAGNTSQPSETVNITVDTTAPLIDIDSIAGDAQPDGNEPAGDDIYSTITGNEVENGFTISGTTDAEDNQNVTISILDSRGNAVLDSNSNPVQYSATVSNGSWSVDVPANETWVANGEFQIKATVSDIAGNAATPDIDTTTIQLKVVIDLDADDSSTATDNGFKTTYIDNFGAVSVADTDVELTGPEGVNVVSATIDLTNAQTGDVLQAGNLPAGITAQVSANGDTVTLTGESSLANYEHAIQAVTFANTKDVQNDEITRTVEVTIVDSNNYTSSATTEIDVVQTADVVSIQVTDDYDEDSALINGIPFDGSNAYGVIDQAPYTGVVSYEGPALDAPSVTTNGLTNDVTPTIDVTLDTGLYAGQTLEILRYVEDIDGNLTQETTVYTNSTEGATSATYTESALPDTEGTNYVYKAQVTSDGTPTSEKAVNITLDTEAESITLKIDTISSDIASGVLKGFAELDGTVFIDKDKDGIYNPDIDVIANVDSDGVWSLSVDNFEGLDQESDGDYSTKDDQDSNVLIDFVDAAGNSDPEGAVELYYFDNADGAAIGTLSRRDEPVGGESFLGNNSLNIAPDGSIAADGIKSDVVRFADDGVDKIIINTGSVTSTANTLSFFTGNGDDYFTTLGNMALNTRLYLEEGDDKIEINRIVSSDSDLTIMDTGAGNDLVNVIENVQAATIYTRTGNDVINVNGFVGINSKIVLGDGADILEVNELRRGTIYSDIVTYDSDYNINGMIDDGFVDNIKIDGFNAIAGTIYIGHNDTLTNIAGDAKDIDNGVTVNILSESGQNAELDLGVISSGTINIGSGDDILNLASLTGGEVNLGDGADTLNIAGALNGGSINMGAGDDNIVVNDNGEVDPIGTNNLNGGAGIDTLSLNGQGSSVNANELEGIEIVDLLNNGNAFITGTRGDYNSSTNELEGTDGLHIAGGSTDSVTLRGLGNWDNVGQVTYQGNEYNQYTNPYINERTIYIDTDITNIII